MILQLPIITAAIYTDRNPFPPTTSVAANERIAADNNSTGYNPSTLNLILASNFENPLPKIAPIIKPKASDLKKLNIRSNIDVSGWIIK